MVNYIRRRDVMFVVKATDKRTETFHTEVEPSTSVTTIGLSYRNHLQERPLDCYVQDGTQLTAKGLK